MLERSEGRVGAMTDSNVMKENVPLDRWRIPASHMYTRSFPSMQELYNIHGLYNSTLYTSFPGAIVSCPHML